MQLIPVLEIEPLDFSENNYEYPKKTVAEVPNEWHEFWLKSISDSNLENLKPIKKGSYFVVIDTISDKELEIIVTTYLKDINLQDYENMLNSFFGGIVLKEEDEIIILPQCCGDLSDHNGWEKIEKSLSHKWEQLWIGHPWVYIRKQNEKVEFTEYTEYDKNIEDLKILYTMPQEVIISEMKNVNKQLINFQKKVYNILIKKKVNHALEISKIITGTIDL
jgi:hypothetical protein